MYNQNQLARDIRLVSRITVTVGGQAASDHDHAQFRTTALLRFGLEADLRPGTPLNEACAFRRALGSVSTLELTTYFADFKQLKLSYLNFIQENPGGTWRSFKRSVADSVQNHWILGTCSKFFDNPAHMLQWLAFDERLLLNSLDSEAEEISAYVQYEQELAFREYPEDVCKLLRGIISDWLSGIAPGNHLPSPCFGPGAFSEMSGRIPSLWKACDLAPDVVTVKKLCSIYGCDSDDLFPNMEKDCFGSQPGLRTNKILFVPKSATKHRIISKEPLWLTWLQHAIKDTIYDYTENHPEMFTWYKDQARSRSWALKGSVDGSYATIDYSSASDSVTVALVASLFKDTYWADLLMLTRSTHAELPDGTILKLEKFAPMGSATCFCTMDTIILSMCELSVRASLGRRGRYGDYVVYGDDAIIRADCADYFLQLSEALGLTPNLDKTYWRLTPKCYRESCGIEAFDGADITPLRYSRKQEPLLQYKAAPREHPQCDIGDIDWFTSQCKFINRLQLAGYQNARSVAVQLIKRTTEAIGKLGIWYGLPRIDMTDYLRGKDIPLSVVVPDGTATNFHSKFEWDPNLQIGGPRCYQAQTIPEDWHDELDDIAYPLWFFAAQSTDQTAAQDAILRGSAGVRSRKWARRIISM